MQIEKNAARKHYRIELPARISIGDKVYNVQDWSLGGFLGTKAGVWTAIYWMVTLSSGIYAVVERRQRAGARA